MQQSLSLSSISSKSTSSLSKSLHQESQLFLKQAVVHHESKNYESAIQMYHKAIKLNPNKPATYYNLGLLYKDVGKYEKSAKCLEKAVELCADYVEAYINLGNVYKKLKDVKMSQKYYLLALQHDSGNVAALTNLGLLYKITQKYDQAEQLFRTMITKDPSNPNSYNSLAVILKTCKKYEDAIGWWKKAIQVRPDYVDAYYNVGLVLGALGRVGEAEEYLGKAQGLRSGDPVILLVRAINLHKMKNQPQAFALLTRINILLQSQPLQSLKKRTNLSTRNLKWLKSSLNQLNSLSVLNQQKSRMSLEQQSMLNEINDQYFASMIDAESKGAKEGEENEKGDKVVEEIRRKVGELERQMKMQERQMKMQERRMDKVEEAVEEIKYDVEQLKKQFEWDVKFDELLKKYPEYAGYFRSLYTMLSTSIQSYRAISTGIVAGGEGVIRSKAGNFIDKVAKILGILGNVPLVGRFCQVFVKVGELYLRREANYVVNQIIACTNSLYNDKLLAKAVSQAILYLCKQPQYVKTIKRKRSTQLWNHILISKLESIKQFGESKEKQLLVKTTGFGGHDLSEEMNMAMEHCAELLITMIRVENFKVVEGSDNALLKAAELWVKELRTIKVKIVGVSLQKPPTLFSHSSYCRIVHGKHSYQTDTSKNNGQSLEWSQNEYTLTKQAKIQEILLQIYDKSTFKKDVFVGKAWIYDNYERGKGYTVDVCHDGEVIGVMEVYVS